MEIWYLDTSAMAKFVRPEAETESLRQWLSPRRWIVSDIDRTELRRAAARAGGRALARAERLLAESDIIRIDAEVFDRAGQLLPLELRSLDALHLAAAMTLGPDLAGVVAYDQRLRAASRSVGIEAVSPGSTPDGPDL